MITDANLQLSAAQAVTVTAVSTNTIDLSVARDIGEGKDLYAVFTVGTAFAGGTSTTFEIIGATDAALTTGIVSLGMSDVELTAALVAGKQVAVRINPQIASNGQRYLGARYTVVGTNTAGTVTCDIVETIGDGRKAYASGFSVL